MDGSPFGPKPLQQGFIPAGGDQNYVAAGISPGLCQGQAAHEVAGAHFDTRIGPDSKTLLSGILHDLRHQLLLDLQVDLQPLRMRLQQVYDLPPAEVIPSEVVVDAANEREIFGGVHRPAHV